MDGEPFWNPGVVKNGQVVLEMPPPLPTSTVGTVTTYDQLPKEPLDPFDPDAAERADLGTCFSWRVILFGTGRIVIRVHQRLERYAPPAPQTTDDRRIAATALVHKLPPDRLDPGRFAGAPGLTPLQPF